MKHCENCKRCVNRYDHHCNYIGNCVGNGNKYIFYFLLFYVACFLILLVYISFLILLNKLTYNRVYDLIYYLFKT